MSTRGTELPHPPDLMYDAVSLTPALRRTNTRTAIALALGVVALFAVTFAIVFAYRWIG